MSALADALRGLVSIAEEHGDPTHTAFDALRKHAPCGDCGGCGRVFGAMGPGDDVLTCGLCSGTGWTPASVEAAISRAEERDAEVERLRKENAILHKEREACWKEVRGYPLRDDCLPDVLPDRIREIVKDANQRRAGVLYSAGIGRSAGEDHGS